MASLAPERLSSFPDVTSQNLIHHFHSSNLRPQEGNKISPLSLRATELSKARGNCAALVPASNAFKTILMVRHDPRNITKTNIRPSRIGSPHVDLIVQNYSYQFTGFWLHYYKHFSLHNWVRVLCFKQDEQYFPRIIDFGSIVIFFHRLLIHSHR